MRVAGAIKLMLTVLALLLPSLAWAQSGGPFVRPDCSTLTSPSAHSTACFDTHAASLWKSYTGDRWVRGLYTHTGAVNVKDYGAVGDNATDDTHAVALAVRKVARAYNGTGPSGVVLFPPGTYKITGGIEVPPGVLLKGMTPGFSTNLTAGYVAAINKAYDGIAFRLVRRNAAPGSLFHRGGIEDLHFTGQGSSDTTASRFIELGDSSDVSTSTGAWNVSIKRNTFSFSSGYGVYAAHTQEAQIDGNFFRGVKFPVYYRTVVASSQITRNTILDESAISGAIAMQFAPGTLGGTGHLIVADNYVLGFEYGLWATSIAGLSVTGNSFEGTYYTPLWLDKYLADTVTNEGDGPRGFSVTGNSFIAWAANGADFPAIQLSFAANGFVGGNLYQNPNGAVTAILKIYDNSTGVSASSVIVEPVRTGTGSATGLQTNALTTRQNTIIGRSYLRPQGTAFLSLGAPDNGQIVYCYDCTKTTPCAGSGNGALAKRLNGAWDCD